MADNQLGMLLAGLAASQGVQGQIGRQQEAITPVSQMGGQLTGLYGQAAPGIGAGMWGSTGYDPASAVQAGQQLQGSVAGIPGYMGQIGQMAFDPQSALYARTAQQLQDQTRGALAARGLGMDPYGAGVEGKTMSDFNIDWQNNLLNRALQGAQGLGSLEQTYGKGLAGGQELQMAGPQFQAGLLSSLLGAGNQAIAPNVSAAGLQAGVTGAQQGLMNSQLNFLSNLQQNQQQQQQYRDQQQQGMFGGLGQLFGGGLSNFSSIGSGLGSIFGGGSGAVFPAIGMAAGL